MRIARTAIHASNAYLHIFACLSVIASLGFLQLSSVNAGAQSRAGRFPIAAKPSTTGTSATLLPDGQWLLLGGRTQTSAVTTSQIYDPVQQKLRTLESGLLHARAYHTATLMADGQVFILGGENADGSVVIEAELFDPEKATFQAVSNLAVLPRTRHGATLLVDGRLLLTGGRDANGTALADAELIDIATQQVERFNAKLETARLSHLASLLPNHSVLIWDGVDTEGRPVAETEIYDPHTQQFAPYSAKAASRALAALNSPAPPALIDSEPDNGKMDVGVDALLSLRFSKPLAVASVNTDTVVLIGPDGQVPVRVTPTEGGLVAFVLPEQELLPSASYALIIQGAVDQQQQALGLVSIGFQTQALGSHTAARTKSPRGLTPTAPAVSSSSSLDSQAQQAQSGTTTDPTTASGNSNLTTGKREARSADQPEQDDDDEWKATPEHRKGRWASRRKFNHSRDTRHQERALQKQLDGMSERARKITLERMQVTGELQDRVSFVPLPGVESSKVTLGANENAITGQVLKLNGKPLADVTLSMAGRTTQTDKQGEFVLTGVPLGEQILVIDGRSANNGNKQYGRFEYRLEVTPGLNDLDFTIWMPRLDTRNAVRIPSPTTSEVVLAHPDIPGLEVRIPAGAVIRDAEGKIVTEISLTPIPIDQPPFPLPGFDIPVYFTVQPGGAHIETVGSSGTTGGRIIYPNYSGEQPGALATFWNYDPTAKGWYAYGTGAVTADGTQVAPDPGVVVYEFTGAMFNSSNTPATAGPNPDGCSAGKGGGPSATDSDGDPVSCHSGLFLEVNTDLSVADVLPLSLTRTYRQNDANSRSFGIGTNHPYSMFLWSAQQYQEVDLILPDSGRVHYVRTSPGTGYSDAVFTHTSSATAFYGSTISWRGGGWALKLKDGSVLDFPQYAPLASITDRYGNRITVMRANGSTSGNITRLVSPNGRWIEFTYDTSNRVKTATDNLGRVARYDYDVTGRLIKVTNLKGGVTEYTYDTAHRMLTVKDPRLNRKVLNEYDANGRVKTQTYADNTSNSFTYTLDATGKVIQTDVSHERGDIRRITYSANGYTLTNTYALGKPEQQTITYERNASNLVTKVTDALGRITEYQYDTKGNVTKLTRMFGTASATSWTYTYEPVFTQLKTVTDPLARTTTLAYDSKGNVQQISDPLGNKTTFTYDLLGRPLTIIRYNGGTALTSTFTYDGPDLVQITDPLNRSVTLTPDVVGRLLSVRDPLGQLSRFTYDPLDQITSQIDPQGKTVSYAYDANGNLLTFTDPKGQVTKFDYDVRNRVISKTDALLKVESYKYDAAGNLIFVTDRKGQISGFDYDFLQRRIKSSYGATSTSAPVYTSNTTYVYDKANRLTQVQDSIAGTITRSYDDRFNTLKQEVTPEGTVTYTYYANGLRNTMTPTGGTTLTYGYDNANRLTNISQAGGAGGGPIPVTTQIVTFGYDTADRQTNLTLPNGIQITYGHDNASQLTSITYKKADATVIGNLAYTYDANGQRTVIGGTLANTGLPTPFGTALFDANNRLTKLDAVTYTYDNNGNLLSDGTTTYTWNARDQLVSVSGANTSTFTYDGLGRRRQKGTVSTLYDGWNPIQLKNNATVVENRLTGLGLDTYYARVTGGAVQSYLTDALGSTLQLSDAAQTSVADYTYDPYGGTSTSINTNVVKYTGREQDFVDLYYYRNRYYKPSIGRFISEDPMGLAGGSSNFYSYVHADPISRLDPMGWADKKMCLSCPSTPPTDDPGWYEYKAPGHCSFLGVQTYKENRVANDSLNPQQECGYLDKKLIDLLHPDKEVYRACAGTPDAFTCDSPFEAFSNGGLSRCMDHTLSDTGGPLNQWRVYGRNIELYFKRVYTPDPLLLMGF